MIVVDTSAVLAILFEEPEGPGFVSAIVADPSPRMSAVNYLEAFVVADQNPLKGKATTLAELFAGLKIVVVDATRADADVARKAYRRYGKGNHPARLNMGDCFAYALAKSRGEPLLCKGGDFGLTDIAIVKA